MRVNIDAIGETFSIFVADADVHVPCGAVARPAGKRRLFTTYATSGRCIASKRLLSIGKRPSLRKLSRDLSLRMGWILAGHLVRHASHVLIDVAIVPVEMP